METTIIQAITFSIALLGAVLGIINTWKAFDRDRVKMRVTPMAYGSTGHGVVSSSNADHSAEDLPGMCIEVVNLSSFALTISEVGLVLKNKKRGVLIKHALIDGERLPKRIDPHHSVTVYSNHPKGETMVVLREASKAYAKTESGVVQTGTSPLFRLLMRRAKEMTANRTVDT